MLTLFTLILQGVGQTAQRAGVIVGVELPLYDICKHKFISKASYQTMFTTTLRELVI